MRYRDCGSAYNVSVSSAEVYAFARRWPCAGFPGQGVTFQFDARNGDLLDMWPNGWDDGADGSAVLALSEDAQNYGKARRAKAATG